MFYALNQTVVAEEENHRNSINAWYYFQDSILEEMNIVF